MKRLNNLYENIYDFNNILSCFNEVCRNTKNKNKVNKFKNYKCIHISRIYNDLKNKTYKVSRYNVFYIYEPKKRRIVSLNMYDKVINHLVSRYILNALEPCLIDSNCALRKNKGTRYALDLYYKYRFKMNNKYGSYYLLKCDIKSYFSSIDLNILKNKISKKIKDKNALNIVYNIIDSDDTLSIGFMTSQILGIYYLNDLDHFIKEELKIKYYVRYQDDFILIHNNKNYLKYCLNEIKKFLYKEKLELNKKTRIYKNTNNFIFLGRNIYGSYSKFKDSNKKLKLNKKLYYNNLISFNKYINSYICYKNINKNYFNYHIRKDC